MFPRGKPVDRSLQTFPSSLRGYREHFFRPPCKYRTFFLFGPLDTSRQPCSTLKLGAFCAVTWVAPPIRIAIPNINGLIMKLSPKKAFGDSCAPNYGGLY